MFVILVLAPAGATLFRQGCSAPARYPCDRHFPLKISPIRGDTFWIVILSPLTGLLCMRCDDYRGFALTRYTPAYNLPPLAGLLFHRGYSRNDPSGGLLFHGQRELDAPDSRAFHITIGICNTQGFAGDPKKAMTATSQKKRWSPIWAMGPAESSGATGAAGFGGMTGSWRNLSTTCRSV